MQMNSSPARLDAQLGSLEQALRAAAPAGHFSLAFSGGLDSRFLAYCAKLFAFSVRLLHISGPHVAAEESRHARDWARDHGFPFAEISMDPLSVPLVAAGDKRRCYGCKSALFSRLLREAGRPLCDGTNASDGLAYRPGAQAIRELGILSPLAMCGLTKADIHRLAEKSGMDDPWQRPRPCLLTRLPYGMQPERSVLEMLDRGESAVRRSLGRAGLPPVDFRLRLTAPGRLELHVLLADEPVFAMLPWARLQADIAGAAPGLPVPELAFLETLSGYYDHGIGISRDNLQHQERP